jgi:hypothetical protein
MRLSVPIYGMREKFGLGALCLRTFYLKKWTMVRSDYHIHSRDAIRIVFFLPLEVARSYSLDYLRPS